MRRAVRKLLYGEALRRPLSVVALLVLDAVALSVGSMLPGFLSGRADQAWALLPVLVVLGLLIFWAHDLYDRAAARRNPGAFVGAVMWWGGLLVLGSVVYVGSPLTLNGGLLSALVALVVGGALRMLYEGAIERVYRRGSFKIPTLVVGEGGDRERVIRSLEDAEGPYSLAGELDLPDGRLDLGLLRRALDETGVRSVVLAGAERLSDEELLDLLRSVRLRRVKIRVVPGAISLLGSRPQISADLGLPLLEVGYPRLDNTQRTLKRLLDVTGSLAGLVVLSPLLLGVAVAVKVTSPGPILYRQKRVGADEEVFLFYKFRSMYRDADRRQAALEAKNEAEGAVFKMRDDPRVTPVGRFIRRWSIDELPQLINVLKGEMSLVGPRPLPLRDFEKMSEFHKGRLAAIPGMSGYWQISGRSDLSFEEMVRLDLYYIENWSLSFDVKIILKTIGAVLRHEGAY
jgi:exopolysaccharide biosynthesis polyprenyl glycosylphosphotransferase